MHLLTTEAATAPSSVSALDSPPRLYMMPLKRGVRSFNVSGSRARTLTYSEIPVLDGVTFIASSCSSLASSTSIGVTRGFQKGMSVVNSFIGSLTSTIPIPAGTTRTLIFEATAPLQAGNYYNEVWVHFLEYEDKDAGFTWPSSLVMMADTYQITIDGQPASEVFIIDGNAQVRRWTIP